MVTTVTRPGLFLAVILFLPALGAVGTEILPACRPAATNLIQNPGFENTGPTTFTRTTSPWVGEETGVARVLNDGHSHSGSQEAAFVVGGTANQGQLMQMFNCSANTDYVASAWIGGTPNFSTVGQPANNDTTGKATQRGFGIHIPSAPGTDPDGDGDTQGFDASIIIKYVTITNNSTGSYQFYSFTFNSGSHTKLFVDFDANLPANGILRVDDVSVTLAGSGPVAPAITTEPASQTVAAGHTATFSVAASGTAPLSYQWEKNGTAIPGATSSSYATPATTTADNGAAFRVVVTNAAGSVTSSSATLTVTSSPVAPSITTQPANQSVTVGHTATFTVAASGTAPLSYQWEKNGTTISGATSSSYTTPATATADNGATFRVVVTNAAGSVTSSGAILTVTGAAVAPSITTQPANESVTAGQTATFTVAASGTAPLSYQWEKNGTAISGATLASYTTPATTTSDSGEVFRVVVTNSAGSVTSNPASLTVSASTGSLPPPWIDVDVGAVGVTGSATFSAGTFQVSGAGSDIGGTADSFNFVYQALSGDGSITAQVTGLGNTSPGAQAGVMIRETLNPDSPFADMLLTPGDGASFQGRSTPGATNWNDGGPKVTAPYWLRVSRVGNTFTGATSTDGKTWTTAGTATISMTSSVFIGLAVVSQKTTTLDVATYDSVSGTGGWSPAGTGGTSGGAGTSATTASGTGGGGSGGATCGATGAETLLALALAWSLRRRGRRR
jgi:hypothetical protein